MSEPSVGLNLSAVFQAVDHGVRSSRRHDAQVIRPRQRRDAPTYRKAGHRWAQRSPLRGVYEKRGRPESVPRAIGGAVNVLIEQSAPAFLPALMKSRNQFERTCW